MIQLKIIQKSFWSKTRLILGPFLKSNNWFFNLAIAYYVPERDAEMSSEQPSPTPTNPLSTKDDLPQNLKPNCKDHYRY